MRRLIDSLRRLFAELRRRSVFKVASVYAVTAWGAVMGASSLFPAFGAPSWAVPMFVAVVVLGFPIAVALAWAYELKPADAVPDAVVPAPGMATPRPGAAVPHDAPEDGTQLLQPSSIRVQWEDGRGRHDRLFSRNFRIGRDASCDVHLDDPLISRRHAAVDFLDGLWWVSDLGSRNGTLLNGKRVSRAPMPGRCELRLHEQAQAIQFEVISSPDACTVTSSRIQLTNE